MAVIGVALATVLGIFVGIGTLSQNWLLARITTGYVDLLRNVPVLLQLILWYTIMINDRFLPSRGRPNRCSAPILRSAACISRSLRPKSAGSRPSSASPSPVLVGCSAVGPRRAS